MQHGDKVTLLLHIVTKARSSASCSSSVEDVTLKTKVINVQRSLAANN